MKTVNFSISKNLIKVDCDSTEFVPAYFHYLLLAHQIKNTRKMKIMFNDGTVRLKKIDGEYRFERI
jgi:hypothetical protein